MGTDGLRLALDLGTTSLAGRLLDGRGRVHAEAQVNNPQGVYGSDIIQRLERAREGEGPNLQRLLLDGLKTLLAALLRQADCNAAAIVAAAAAGNPGICHLLRGLPVEPLLFPPHRPRERGAVLLAAAELDVGLVVPVYLFPLVSGYVGGDLVAFLYAQQPAAPGSLFLDIGTNGEMALYAEGRWWATSVAAGPAFEGGGLACGMPAGPGAIVDAQLAGDDLRFTVLGGGPPRGLCGSGLAAVVAAALEGGLLDRHGTLVEPLAVPGNLSRHIVEVGGGRVLRLYRDATVDLLLTQEDIRRFQLAKAAVRAGAVCLLARAGVSAERIEQVIVTGAFGFSLPAAVLKRVAMLPEIMVDRVRFAEAGVLAGCGRRLLDKDAGAQVAALAQRLQAYPLSGTPAFERAFLNAMEF
ncbi:ASKHA domain-containing protein [Desulfuromonas sp. CSMB_57]|uniref:ASKHA domain-containing protein n=1 Tax=Desulfuromonas sp. CSMB_57 TaxID=2807629 RepID=UPI001CD1DD0B|nr:ASKHA domain-containing protein [Desulfuromonas sp. CSMB_57]